MLSNRINYYLYYYICNKMNNQHQVPLDINSLPVGDNPTLSREEEYNRQSGNINLDLNEYVRNKLLSRGITIARSSPYYIKQQQEQERKKTLLENIQNQMNL